MDALVTLCSCLFHDAKLHVLSTLHSPLSTVHCPLATTVHCPLSTLHDACCLLFNPSSCSLGERWWDTPDGHWRCMMCGVQEPAIAATSVHASGVAGLCFMAPTLPWPIFSLPHGHSLPAWGVNSSCKALQCAIALVLVPRHPLQCHVLSYNVFLLALVIQQFSWWYIT